MAFVTRIGFFIYGVFKVHTGTSFLYKCIPFGRVADADQKCWEEEILIQFLRRPMSQWHLNQSTPLRWPHSSPLHHTTLKLKLIPPGPCLVIGRCREKSDFRRPPGLLRRQDGGRHGKTGARVRGVCDVIAQFRPFISIKPTHRLCTYLRPNCVWFDDDDVMLPPGIQSDAHKSAAGKRLGGRKQARKREN